MSTIYKPLDNIDAAVRCDLRMLKDDLEAAGYENTSVTVRFKDGKLPKEFTPMKVYGENAAKLFLKTLYTCSTRSMDGKITFDMIPERVIGFEFARGGVVRPP